MDGAYRSRADARLLRGDGSPRVARVLEVLATPGAVASA